MKKGTIVAIVGVILTVVCLLTIISQHPVIILLALAGVGIYLLGHKLNQAKK